MATMVTQTSLNVISTLPVLFLIVLCPLKYSYTLLFSAEVHVQHDELCSTEHHYLLSQTPFWWRMLENIFERCEILLRVHALKQIVRSSFRFTVHKELSENVNHETRRNVFATATVYIAITNILHRSCNFWKTEINTSSVFLLSEFRRTVFQNLQVCHLLTYLLTYSMEQGPSWEAS